MRGNRRRACQLDDSIDAATGWNQFPDWQHAIGARMLRSRDRRFDHWGYRNIRLKREAPPQRARVADDNDRPFVWRRKVGQFYVVENVAGAERPIRRRIVVNIMVAEDLVLIGLELRLFSRVLGAGHD